MRSPETRYARTADGVHIAFQVAGTGPVDLVYVPGWISNIELTWELPEYTPFMRRLASTYRLIVFDRRGSGASDRPPSDEALAFEFGVDDIRAVMDAAGSERAVLFGFEDGAPLSAVFAATYPDRTHALVLFAAWARYREARDYPWGADEEQLSDWTDHVRRHWGTEEFWRYNLQWVAPSYIHNDDFVRTWARYSRLCASPGSIAAIEAALHETDVRTVLPAIRVPTLVMNREGNRAQSLEESRWICEQIAGAVLGALPGDEHAPFMGDTAPVLEALDRFVLAVGDEEAELDRVLATVIFTDIVGSTATSSALGDRAWRALLERHHAIVRAMLARYRGTEIDTAGDGFFATFDGPARGVRCALAIAEAVRPLGIEIRAGVHTGEVTSIDGKTGGLAVTIGARVGAKADASIVLASQTVKDLVAGSGLTFEDAGEHELKGVPDRWHLYRVVP
ncbi:MAG TPA: adenylate/guanylate cyclase domain-containing protein [Actinomycetota bacterium]|nr:adenylate/guanylate cyclase domain-containing protein [Actinomycetota bacterium]